LPGDKVIQTVGNRLVYTSWAVIVYADRHELWRFFGWRWSSDCGWKPQPRSRTLDSRDKTVGNRSGIVGAGFAAFPIRRLVSEPAERALPMREGEAVCVGSNALNARRKRRGESGFPISDS
jgi:hypothetical protein